MRLLLLNPNTTSVLTDRMMTAAGRVCAPTTQITPLTAPRGVPYIATRAEAQIAGAIALEMLAACHDQHDAAIIAAFGDPGLGGARELFSLPIVGLAEAGMLMACTLGRRFSIVTFAAALEPWYHECVEWHGLGGRCASIRTLDAVADEGIILDLDAGSVMLADGTTPSMGYHRKLQRARVRLAISLSVAAVVFSVERS